MTLIQLEFAPDFAKLPDEHADLAQDALARTARLSDVKNPDRCPTYVMTTPAVAWSILIAAKAQLPLSQNSFCEWGAGIGLVTCLATRAGFHASGIELEPVLIAEGEALMAAHGVDAALVCGDYKPEGFFERTGDASGLGLFEAAVVYAYAWPAEADALKAFFARNAPDGTVLILYEGGTTVTAYQQIGA